MRAGAVRWPALLMAALLLAAARGARAQFAPQPPLTTDACAADGSQLTCGPASGPHRCCAARTSKCGAAGDGTPLCSFCQRSCSGGPLAFDCRAGFKCGLGADGCAGCVPDPTGTGSFERRSPPPPPLPRQQPQAATAIGSPKPLAAGAKKPPPPPPRAKPSTAAAKPAAAGCSPACAAGFTCAWVTPTPAAAAMGAAAGWRCVQAPKQAATTGRRMLQAAAQL